ncbi:hypothetical protein RYX36_007088 [Vicia faba]
MLSFGLVLMIQVLLFLFLMVLSMGKALSIQAHPDKELARRLHKLHPDVYKDGNHKPEMALAMTDFEALCGFITLEELKDVIHNVPEVVKLLHHMSHLSHVGHFHPMPTMSPLQPWKNQQAVSEGLQVSIHDNPTSSQADQNLIRSDAKFNYEISVNGQTLPREYLDAHVHQGEEVQTVVSSSAGETHLQQISSQFSEALRLNSFKTNGEIKNPVTISNDGPASQILLTEQGSSAANVPSVGEMIQNNSHTILSETLASTGQTTSTTISKVPETALLDERSLLACIVRTIPAAGSLSCPTGLSKPKPDSISSTSFLRPTDRNQHPNSCTSSTSSPRRHVLPPFASYSSSLRRYSLCWRPTAPASFNLFNSLILQILR